MAGALSQFDRCRANRGRPGSESEIRKASGGFIQFDLSFWEEESNVCSQRSSPQGG
jgi:hypothetical protein